MSTKTLADKIRAMGARMFLSSKPISYTDEVQLLVELCADIAEALERCHDELRCAENFRTAEIAEEILAKARALVTNSLDVPSKNTSSPSEAK